MLPWREDGCAEAPVELQGLGLPVLGGALSRQVVEGLFPRLLIGVAVAVGAGATHANKRKAILE